MQEGTAVTNVLYLACGREGGGAEKPLQMGVGDSDSAILFVEGRGATKQKQKQKTEDRIRSSATLEQVARRPGLARSQQAFAAKVHGQPKRAAV